MLEIVLPQVDGWDDEREEFVELPEVVLRLEHSLLSLSKWEAEHSRPFLDPSEKTEKDMLEYIHAMCLEPVPMRVLSRMTTDDVRKISAYIEDARSGTTITTHAQTTGNGPRYLTSELIYAYMSALEIPYSPSETWHLNRLITLIRTVGTIRDPKPQKRNMSDAIAERNALNAQRKAEAAKRRKRY